MSYILEALKRADAERDRGRVPTLRSQDPAQAAAGIESAPAGNPWLWLMAGLVLAVAAMAGWRLWAPGSEPAPAVVAASPATPPDTAADNASTAGAGQVSQAAPNAAASADAATPRSASGASRAMPSTSSPPAAAAARPATRPAALADPGRATARARPDANDDEPTPTARRSTAKTPPAGKAADDANAARSTRNPNPKTAAPSKPPAEPSTPPARIYTLNELPDEIRRSLPKLAISGSVYSASAGSRMLIVNGQLFHEGDTLVPGLTLESIRLKEAVLNFRGYHYEVSY